MKNQEKEYELYSKIGQYLADSMDYNSIENWDRSILTVKSSGDGFTELRIDYEHNGIMKNTMPMSAAESSIYLYDVIDELRDYTNDNDYARWNKFIFELNSNQKFEIEYLWDQNFQDDRE